MASTEQQIDDAVAKRHVQNTDTALGVQSAPLDMNLHKIIGLEDPTGDKDAAHKQYVDDNVGAGGVIGPSSAIANAIPLFDGTTGKLIKDSTRLIEDTMTDGSNIPDGHAVKEYGDTYWGDANCINVKSYGAVGNGAVDDATAIQNALNAAYTGKKCVFVPEGQYLIGTTLTIKDGVTLGGVGWESEFLAKSTLSGAILTNHNHDPGQNQYVLIRDMCFDGKKAQRAAGYCLYFNNLQWSRITNVKIENSPEYGIWLDGSDAFCDEISFVDCLFRYNENSGIYIYTASANMLVNCSFYSNNMVTGYAAITIHGGSQNVVNGCSIMSNHQHGIFLSSSYSTTIKGCVLINNKRHGIYLNTSANDNVVSGNICDGNSEGSSGTYSGIVLEGTTLRNTVNGNRCYNGLFTSNTQQYGIIETGTADYNVIVGNSLTGNLSDDLVVVGAHTKAYHNMNVAESGGGSGYTNLTQFVDQTAWRLFYSDSLGDVTELALGTSGQYLKATGATSVPIWDTPSGAGDVVGPASAINNAIPLFDGTTGKLIKDSTRLIEDTMTDGSNIPDGHAIKTYGNANWGSGVLKIAVVGDSLSQPTNFRDTWSSQFEKLCDEMGLPVTVENYAVCGDRFYDAKHDHTEHESGTRSQVEQTIAHGADFVFVMLGVNDAIFSGGRTSSQIIADAQAVYNDLHAGLPLATIVYLEELPHNGGSLSPSSLTNGECLPYTHQLITYKGKSNCRVNNAAYTATSISSANLTKYQTWGTASTSIRAIYDAYITINFWKIIRMGLAIDFIGHVDTFGHMMMAHYVLRWFKDHNGVDNKVLDVDIWTNDEKAVMDPDYFYDEVMAGTFVGASGGRYLEINDLLARAESWFYRQRYWMPYIGPEDLDSARNPISVVLKNCQVNRNIYLSWDGGNLADTGKTTTSRGEFHHTWIGPELTTSFNWTVGTKELAYAVEVDDGSYDVYNVGIVLTQPPHKSHVRYRRDASQNIPNGSFTVIRFNNKEYDTLSEYTSANGRFTADEPGYYQISGGVTSDPVSWPAGKYWCVWIYKNGSMYACGDTHVADAAIYTVKSSYVNSSVYLGVGDYIDLRIYHSQGGYVNVRTDTVKQNYISVDRSTL